jgi:hypothetical protein
MEEQPTNTTDGENAPAQSIFDQAQAIANDTQETLPQPPEPIVINPEDFGIDLTDHNPEAQAIKQDQKKDGVAPLEERPHPHTRIQNPNILQDPVGDAVRDLDPFSDNFDIGKVEVTARERDQFVRAALHDTEMIFDIYLEGIDAYVKVAIPTESFTALTGNMLEVWDSKGVADARSNVSWLLTFQQMHAWYQIREFAGLETQWASFFDDGVPKISAIRKHLEDPENLDAVVNMNSARWRMMVNAMALAEYKYKMCLDAWRTRAFFAKADTD